MPLSAFSDRFAAYDVTPVENLFLLEYMPHAPGDYVRVYLYGLMQCHHPDADATLDGMARVLSLKPDQVLAALRYWEQKGLVVGVSDNPPQFRFENVRSAMMNESGSDPQGAYQYKEFNNQLQSMLGLLHPQQFQKAMEWVEDLKLPTDVVLAIVREKLDQLTEGGARKRSLPYLFKAFETCAMEFSERGIKTSAAAMKELSRGRPGYKLAMKVLDYYNLRRSPTTAEVELAEKWLSTWKMDERAVMAGLKQTANAANPSFAYLDRILERHAAPEGDAADQIERSKQLFELTKALLTELGEGARAPSADQLAQVQAWLDQGFEPAALVRAAVRCSRSGRHAFEQLAMEISKWGQLGITTAEKAELHNQQLTELRTLATEVFSRAGLDRRPTEADLSQLREWLKRAPAELVLYAAECANGLKLPTRAMAKNLGDWASKGIADVEAAKAERKARTPQPTGPSKTQPPKSDAQAYKQRTYGEGFFDTFFADLSDSGEDGDQP